MRELPEESMKEISGGTDCSGAMLEAALAAGSTGNPFIGVVTGVIAAYDSESCCLIYTQNHKVGC
jgi:hypothetical protein